MRGLSSIWSVGLWLVLACLAGLRGAFAAPPTEPVIVVPGIVGSQLCEGSATGPKLWGGGLLYLGRMAQLALPFSEGTSTKTVVPCGLLDEFAVVGPFDVDVYSGLIDFLVKTGHVNGRTLFVFDYDWRQSNFETAKRLKARVAQIKAQTGAPKVRIVAHSMGGIVTRIYLKNEGGAAEVSNVVFHGTPHLGAAQVMRTADRGWGTLPNWFAGGEDVIRDTLFSWPAAYELIPLRTCCAVSTGPQRSTFLDMTRVSDWAKLKWLPARYRTPTGLAFIERMIRNSLAVRAIMEQPLPPGPVYDVVASRMHATSERTIFTADFTGVARVVNVQGDEAVAFQSASNGMPMSAAVVQRSHPTIFDDLFAQYTMARSFDLDAPALFRRFGGAGARLLTFDPQSDPAEVCPTLSIEQLDPSREGGVQAVLTGEDQSKVCIWRFGMTISAHDPAAPSDGMRVDAKSALAGSEIEVKIDLGGYAADFMKPLRPTVRVIDDKGAVVAEYNPDFVSLSSPESGFLCTYRFKFKLPETPGIYRLDTSHGGPADRSASAYLVVLKPPA